MTKCYQNPMRFSRVKRRQVEVNFNGGDISSDGGMLLLRELDQQLGLTQAIHRAIRDPRVKNRCIHDQLTLLRQRIFALACGYEDLNDHDRMRHDTLLQTAIGQDHELASSATLCRLEQRMDRDCAVQLHQVLVEQFIRSFKTAPKQLILDFDATDNPVHGDQVGKYFSGFYNGYCFLPLYVFCGTQLLVSYLRPASCGAAHHAGAILALLVKRLRQVWPWVQIIFRGDGGFCKPLLLNWCDRHGVDYVIGMAQNSRLLARTTTIRDTAATLYALQQKPQRWFGDIDYAAHTWPHPRRVIIKAEHNAQGANPRFVITSLKQTARYIYETLYCARGNMENRIKEQIQLFSDRTSCHEWWPNQFRLLLSGMAYVLIERLRQLALQGTTLAQAEVRSIQLKLLKIGAVIVRNTRRICILLSSHYPWRDVFIRAAQQLNTC